MPLRLIAGAAGEADAASAVSLALHKLSRVMTVEEEMQLVPLAYVPEVSSSAMLQEKKAARDAKRIV